MTQHDPRSAMPSSFVRKMLRPREDHELLLRETNHRCSNDLQLVVSLLALQSQRATSPEARQALTDAMERVCSRPCPQYHAQRPAAVDRGRATAGM